MKLQLLDELIARGHGDIRSPDCIIAVDRTGLPEPDLKRIRFQATEKNCETLGEFLGTKLADPFQVEVAKIREGNLLALKMSHVIGDAVSMFQLLKKLLGHEVSDGLPELREFPRKKDTPYRDLLNSKLWPRKGTPGSSRKFLYESLHHGERNTPLWNDLMLYSLLEALPFERKSIWVPVNVRKDFWKGFGNGLSRMRIYPPKGANLEEKLSHIRRQKQEAMRNGEVALPPKGLDLNLLHQKILYELWIRRPWADWGSISFSHITNSQGFLDGFRNVRGISNLMPSQNGAVFAVTSGGVTDFTLTYDPSVVRDEEAQILLRDFLTNLRAKL